MTKFGYALDHVAIIQTYIRWHLSLLMNYIWWQLEENDLNNWNNP